jgi:hypothetical protein
MGEHPVAQFFGVKRLAGPEDWKSVVGDSKWSEGFSACELAHSWHQAGGFPRVVDQVLRTSGSPLLADLALDYGLVEKPVFLDTLKGPSWTDVMAYAHNAAGEMVVIAVEGKARESFGSPISEWVLGEGASRATTPKPSRVKRLEYIGAALRTTIAPSSALRYQLLHRTVSALSETELHGGVAAVLLVHSFDESAQGNWADFKTFVGLLGLTDLRKDAVEGPVSLGHGAPIQTFFAWVSDRRRSEQAAG